MHWPKHASGKRSCSIAHSAVRPTLPHVWRAMLALPVEKGTMPKRHASVRKPRRCASRHRQHSSQLSVKHSNRWLQPQERHLTNVPLKGNGTQEQHSRRTKRLTMHCRTERLERRDTALTSRVHSLLTSASRASLISRRCPLGSWKKARV